MNAQEQDIRVARREFTCNEIVGRAIPPDGLPPCRCFRRATVEVLYRDGWEGLCTQRAERRGYAAKALLEATRKKG